MSAIWPHSPLMNSSASRRGVTPASRPSQQWHAIATADAAEPLSSKWALPTYPAYLEKTYYAHIVSEQYSKRQGQLARGLDADESRTALDYVDLRLPSELNAKDKSRFVEVSRNGLRLTYSGPRKNDLQAASARSNRPMRPQCGIYYYEMTVISKGDDGFIGIGFCSMTNNLERLPGWDENSWGYHGDDGHSFGGSGTGKVYGPCFTTGDVVGCGVNFADQTAFYTKNGNYLGIAFKSIKTSIPLFPCVGLRAPGEKVSVNFGQEPFVFNIAQYVKDQQFELRKSIIQRPLVLRDPHQNEHTVGLELVLSYLTHCGYLATADAVARHVQRINPTRIPPVDADMRHRQRIRSAIMTGDMDQAIRLTHRYYPTVFQGSEGKRLLFELHCLTFVEMVRNKDKSNILDRDRYIADMHLDPEDAFGQSPCTLTQPSVSQPHSDDAQMDMDIDMEVDVDVHVSNKEAADDLACGRDLGNMRAILLYGRQLQREYGQEKNPRYQQRLKEIFSLIAYADLDNCPVRHLVDASERDALATQLNTAILASQHKPITTPLERILRQIFAGQDELIIDGHAQSALIDIKDDIMP